MGSSLDPGRRRLAKEIYWNIRRFSSCVLVFVTRYYPGDKQDATYLHLCTSAQGTDAILARAHTQHAV